MPFKLVQYELLRRLFRRLRDHQVYVNIKFDNIESFRDYYIRLNNYWHQTEHLNKTVRPTVNGITTNYNTAARAAFAAVPSKTVIPVAFRTTPALKAAIPSILSGSNYYICGSPDHFAKDCPSGKQARFAPRSATPGQISEIYDGENKKDLPVNEQMDSEKD